MKEIIRNQIRNIISEEFEKKSIITEIRSILKLQNEFFTNLKNVLSTDTPPQDPNKKDLYFKNKKEELLGLIDNIENTQKKYSELNNKFKTITGSDYHIWIDKKRKEMELGKR